MFQLAQLKTNGLPARHPDFVAVSCSGEFNRKRPTFIFSYSSEILEKAAANCDSEA